jgi:hypothetical protein
LCTKAKLPASADTVREFITVCGGTEADADAWVLAWQRLKIAAAIPSEPVDRTQAAGVDADADVVTEAEASIDPATPDSSRSDDEQPVAETPSSGVSPCGAWWAGSVEVRLSVPIGLALFAAGVVVGAILVH